MELDLSKFDIEDSIRLYLNEIGSYPLLSAEEETEYSRQYKEENSIRAKNILIESNLRLVVSIAKGFIGNGLSLLDLVQEGNFGLMKAVDKFDHTKGYRFSTYANSWIKNYISRAISNQSRDIRIPIPMFELMRKIIRARKLLLGELDREPTDKDVSEYLNISVERIKEVDKLTKKQTSLDKPVNDKDETVLGDFIVDEDSLSPFEQIQQFELNNQLQLVLDTLTPREECVIRLRYGIDDGTSHTLEEIGKLFGITRERIRQIEAKSLRKMRNPATQINLKEFIS